jgi:hypothetical protein
MSLLDIPQISPTIFLPLLILLMLWMTPLSSTSSHKRKVDGGIESSPNTQAKERLLELYPPDIHGPGEYVDLPHGRTRYWIVGPETGQKVSCDCHAICSIATRLTAVQVILICGLSVPSIIWHHVGQILAKNGLRALIYGLC